jgi:sulfatase maturation enzyme AslB (radical SAM superfamily)
MSTTCDWNRHDSDYSWDKECHKCDVYEYYSTGAPFLCDVYKEGDAEADKACQRSAWTYDWGW